MRLRVLGCSGGELPRHKTTCFLLDETVALDAGELTSSLSLEALLKVDHVVLSHSHFDHVKDVPLMADLLVGRRRRPVKVHASTEFAQTLRDSVFNGRLWPDFTRIPNPESPVRSWSRSSDPELPRRKLPGRCRSVTRWSRWGSSSPTGRASWPCRETPGPPWRVLAAGQRREAPRR
jgi:ribonuclease BN (tRNA processing enzyme)